MKDKSFKIIENSLEDIKALDTKVLNLQKLNTFTDTLLITSGSSSTHMSAISDRVIDDLKKIKSLFKASKEKIQVIGSY